MTIRPVLTHERTYIRETALKLIQPHGIGFRVWESKATPWINALTTTVLADGEIVVIGFVLEDARGAQVLYVRRKFRGVGLGRELMHGRKKDPVAVGFGPWSDWNE